MKICVKRWYLCCKVYHFYKIVREIFIYGFHFYKFPSHFFRLWSQFYKFAFQNFIFLFHFYTYPSQFFMQWFWFYKLAFENFNYVSKLFLVHLKFDSTTKAFSYNSSSKKQVLDEVGVEPTTNALLAQCSNHWATRPQYVWNRRGWKVLLYDANYVTFLARAEFLW